MAGLSGKGEGIKQKQTNKQNPPGHRQQHGDYQREWSWGRGKVEERIGRINSDGTRLDLGW